jgi:Fe-S cluster assembly protein SufD
MMTTNAAPGLTTPQTHLDAFSAAEKALPGHDRLTIARLRRTAIARFGKLGFPGDRDEDWKFTSVKPILRTPMQVGRPSDSSPAISHGTLPPGVVVTSLPDALAKHPELVEPYLGQHAEYNAHPFVALNTAMWGQGLFLHVPDGVIVEDPILLEFSAGHSDDGPPRLWYRRVLIVLGKGSRATVSENYVGNPGQQYAVNAVSEIVLGEGAVLDHYKVQEESPQAFHLACTQAVVATKATFSTHYVGLGGQLVRNEVRVLFAGQHAEATVNGLYQTSGTQHMDNLTIIDHAQPNCNSHELYKGVLGGKSKGVFAGKIFVRPDAQKTDAKQTNKTLLLSDDATINSKPQLEIFADDVKCTHGATVGQLDAEQLFYLRTRGIGEEQARALLTFAFANDIIRRVKIDPLRRRLEGLLLESSHLPRLTETEDE